MSTVLSGGVSTLALACAFNLTGVALAQEAPDQPVESTDSSADSPYRQDVVTVTVNKRTSTLQDTALAVSAFTGEDIAERGIVDISGLESDIPALHVGQQQDGFKVAIRGIGLTGTSAISDPGVAFYLDGFYVPRPSSGSATFFDISRVEVLRGPQGTLYGRNATGGVVNVIANEPEFEYGGQVGVSYGERDLFETRGVFNVPINDNLAARLSVVHSREDGYTENLSTASGTEDLFGRDGDLSLRGQLKYDNHSDFDALLSFTHTDLNGTGVPLKYLERNIGGPPPTQALLATIPTDTADPLTIFNDSPSYNDTDTTILFGRINKSFSDFDLFLQAGQLEQETSLLQDTDGSEVDVSQFFKTSENEARSAELRISSNSDSALTWLAGLYYFEEETYQQRLVELNGLTPGGVISLPDFLLDEWGDASTAAIFGSATYELSDQVSITGGLRYTEDERGGTKITISNFGQPLPTDLIDVNVTYDQVTWKLGLEWRPTDDLLAYASASNGYKAGGFNLTSSGQPYEPEEVMAYEVGLKSSPFNGRAQLNADAFYYDYTDLQLTNLTSVNNAPGQLTTNAAATTVTGLELTGYYNLTPEWRLSGSYAYIDATFDEYFNTDPRALAPVFNPSDPLGLGRENLAGNMLPFVSEHEASLGLSYVTPVGANDEFTATINSKWHDDMFLREYNDADIDLVDANTRTDASISYLFGDRGLQLTAFVTNIEDETEKNNIQVSPGFVGQSAVAAYTKPRTWGVRADVSF